MSNEKHRDNANQHGSSGNFANDPERESESGRKSHQQSQQGSHGEESTNGSQRGKSSSKGDQQSQSTSQGERGGSQQEGRVISPMIRNVPARPAARAGNTRMADRPSKWQAAVSGGGEHLPSPASVVNLAALQQAT